MADLHFKIDIPDAMLNKINSEVDKFLQEAIVDITNDILMTAQARAPKKKGDLEQSGSMSVNKQAKTGEVSFKAMRRGFNYARKMDKSTYNLGETSRRKPPVKSKFYKGSMPVGTGYLTDTFEKCGRGTKNGYKQYIKDEIGKIIDKHT